MVLAIKENVMCKIHALNPIEFFKPCGMIFPMVRMTGAAIKDLVGQDVLVQAELLRAILTSMNGATQPKVLHKITTTSRVRKTKIAVQHGAVRDHVQLFNFTTIISLKKTHPL